MTDINALLAANQVHAASARPNIATGAPRRRLAVVTCMDTRIDVLAAFGLELGDAQVIRNAGGRVTDDVLRSLAVGSHVLGVEAVVVMQHTKCGMLGVTDDDLRSRTGADIAFLPIDDHTAVLRSDVDLLAGTAYLGLVRTIAGLVYDVDSGAVEDIVRWERP